MEGRREGAPIEMKAP